MNKNTIFLEALFLLQEILTKLCHSERGLYCVAFEVKMIQC